MVFYQLSQRDSIEHLTAHWTAEGRRGNAATVKENLHKSTQVGVLISENQAQSILQNMLKKSKTCRK